MDRKRPQGRQKYVTNNSKGVHRRGSGLGTGPVGSSQSGGQGGGRASGGSLGGRNPLMIIIVLVIALLGGGGGLFGALSGGSSDYGISESAIQNISQNSNTSGWSDTANAPGEKLDESVAKGSRAKRTQILGDGQDQVTVMVYMCGTDLESKSGMATRDLMEMTKASIGDNVNVVVYTGGCNKWNNQVIRNDVNQIYEVVSGGLKCVNQNAGSDAMTKPATLTSFIRWCEQNYPANRRELIFWDHGGGSVSGYGYDEKYARSGSMSLAGINQALKDAGTTFDFIGFDACLMATVENGLMLDQYADYMIASEETEPGIGWYYTNWLTALSGNPSMPTIEIGKNIVDDFISTCNRDCRGQSATLSVVDLAELSYTVPTPFKAFSESLTDMISNQQYTEISTARNGTREFARSSAIDQIDLVHFAQNVGNDEGKKLSDVLLSAVKYNRTSSNMTNSYGMSIYFPYRKTSKVDTALNTYDAIGMDSSYAKCIREFASLEVSGQVSTGGTSSPFPSLLGDLGGGPAGSDAISNLLGSFLGGDFGSISGLSGSNTGFLTGRSMTEEDTVSYISDHYFDSSKLTWSKNKAGQMVISLPEDQWALIEGLNLNMFYDDGEGYVDLGLDNMFDFDDKGNLIGDTDRTWLAINGQPVAYYHEYTEGEGDSAIITGYVPVMLNGERAELLLCFDAEHPRGTITGARSVYTDGQTDTVAKSMTELAEGDTLEFICDFYSYEGVYQDTYCLGEPMTVTDNMEISNVDVGEGTVKIMYRFTDIYQQHYWTEPIEK